MWLGHKYPEYKVAEQVAVELAKIHFKIRQARKGKKAEFNKQSKDFNQSAAKTKLQSNGKNISSLNSISTRESISPTSCFNNTEKQQQKLESDALASPPRMTKFKKYWTFTVSMKKFGSIEDEVLILALIYLTKLLKEFKLDKTSYLKGMFATCTLLAHKFLIEEEVWPLDEFSKLVVIKQTLLEKWEFQILECLNYELFVSPSQFEAFRKEILVDL